MRSLCLLLLTSIPLCAATVEVDSGEARTNAIVRFELPATASQTELWALKAEGSEALAQRDGSHAVAIIPNLKKGKTRFTLTSFAGRAPTSGAQLKTNGPALSVIVGGKPAFDYFFEESPLPRPEIKPIFKRGGYIHPLRTWSGVAVTDDYPANHVHHHGIWNAWTGTEFEGRTPDFWNMGQGSATVLSKGLSQTWAGPVHGGFSAKLQQVDLTSGSPKPALDETWTVTSYANASETHPFLTLDLVITQQCASSSALKLPKYHYGGLGFRGRWEWNGAANTHFLTSEGVTNRVKGNETTGRWCAIAGPAEGGHAGVVILCHPSNFRAPQPMRLHPTEPFFCYAPSQGGDWEIKPGDNYVSKYRVITYDGLPNAEQIEGLWRDYAHPAKTVVR